MGTVEKDCIRCGEHINGTFVRVPAGYYHESCHEDALNQIVEDLNGARYVEDRHEEARKVSGGRNPIAPYLLIIAAMVAVVLAATALVWWFLRVIGEDVHFFHVLLGMVTAKATYTFLRWRVW